MSLLGDQVCEQGNDASGDEGSVYFFFRHRSVNAGWFTAAMRNAGQTVWIEVSQQFLLGAVDSERRLASMKRVASKHSASGLHTGHAWYGVDLLSIDALSECMFQSIENYLFRRAEVGRPTIILVNAHSFETPRLPDLMGWIPKNWPRARTVLVTDGEAASTIAPVEAEALASLMLAADERAEVWFTGAMTQPEAFQSFISNWFSERTLQ